MAPSFGRTFGLTDGVVAIAITLLVLDIHVPHVEPGGSLWLALVDTAPKFYGWLLSFTIIGLFWTAHHRAFRLITRWDDGLRAINLLWCGAIAILPFPAALLGEYPRDPVAVAVYAAFIVIAGLLTTALWVYAATGHRLVRRLITPALAEYMTIRSVSIPAVFAASIVVAFWSVDMAMAMWGLVWIMQISTLRLARRRKFRPRATFA